MIKNNVLKTSVTLSRNIAGHKYPHLLSGKEGKELTNTITNVLKDIGGYSIFDFSTMSDAVVSEYMVKGYISEALVNNANFSAFGISKDNKCRVHINSDNHIEMCIVNDTLDIKNDYDTLDILDNDISSKVKYDFDEKLGYLTTDVSSVGTGLRVSVDMFLPAVVYTGKVNTIYSMLSKMGIDIVDVSKEYGMDSVYRISNIVTLGKKEEQIIALMESATKTLLDIEKDASEKYLKNNVNRVKDTVYKAYGILTHSYYINDEDFAKYISLVRFGANMGLISFANPIDFSKILLDSNIDILKNKYSTQDIDSIYVDRAEYLSKNMSTIKR